MMTVNISEFEKRSGYIYKKEIMRNGERITSDTSVYGVIFYKKPECSKMQNNNSKTYIEIAVVFSDESFNFIRFKTKEIISNSGWQIEREICYEEEQLKDSEKYIEWCITELKKQKIAV